jgi:hypothetical protein
MHDFRLGEERLARAQRLREAAEAELNAAAPDFLGRFALEPYLEELEHRGRPHRFYEFTPRALDLNRQMHEGYPAPIVETYNRFLLAHLMANAERRSRNVIVRSIHPYIREDFDRILKALEKPRAGYYVRDNHLFRRDLAIARLKVIPNGFEFYDLNACIARKEVLNGGLTSLLRFAAAFQADLAKPLYPLYEPHWDRRYVRYFSPEEYERCCLRIADMIEANPGVRGVATPSWWYDPQLKEISPELWFVRDIPEKGGARFMLLEGRNPYLLTDSLAHSPHRKAAYEAGRYKPRSYMIFWPRRELIAWAKRTRATQPDLEARGVPCSVA